jgi:hypothetical protein
MLELVILILDVMDMGPDNDVGPLVRELVVAMRKMPVWERKTEWKRLRLALKHRFIDKISTVELLRRMREHSLDLDEKLKG